MHHMSLQEDAKVHTSLYTLPTIVLLAAVALSFVGLGFVMPLRALYAREIGASSIEVGLMATAFLLASFAVTPAMGWLSDRIGPRTVLGCSLLTYAGLLAAYVPVTSPGALIVLRALEGVSAAGVLTPARALMNTVAPPERYGEALGLVSTARYVGILVGPAVGTLLASGVGYTPAFLAASGILTLTTLAVFLWLPPHTDVGPKAASPVFSCGFTGPLALAYGLAMVLALPQGVTPAIWSLYMQDRGASLPLIGLSFTTFALAASALAPVAGRVADDGTPETGGTARTISHVRDPAATMIGFALEPLGRPLPLAWDEPVTSPDETGGLTSAHEPVPPTPLAVRPALLTPTALAADGGLPNQNTAEGTGALSSLTTGANNTAAGFNALHSLATGSESTATGSLALFNDTSGYNTAYGFSALYSNTTGGFNTATGRNALFSNATGTNNTATGGAALYSNTTGSFNTAHGRNALFSNTTGENNTANGAYALYLNTEGPFNTASGSQALFSNTTGFGNTANGSGALLGNTTGNFNTSTGHYALTNNTTTEANTADGAFALSENTGSENTASGFAALRSNTFGFLNTANGSYALWMNTTGGANTATGGHAMYNNTTGYSNTANGSGALGSNTTGAGNTANGVGALQSNETGNNNTAIGNEALGGFFTNGSTNNIAVGSGAGFNLTRGNNNIDIGNPGVAGDGRRIRIGTAGTQNATFIAGIFGATVANGVQAVVAPNGKLGTIPSSKRFKDQIKPMEKESEAILALKPVTFRYKEEIDPDGIPQFGLIAEEVEKVHPDLVARDEEGKVYTVRYEAVNAMLLNEFLKEHRSVQDLKETVAQQQKQIAAQKATAAQQQKQIQALTATVQKVSDQVALSKPAPQLVANP